MDERVRAYNAQIAAVKARAELAKEEERKRQQELINKRTDEAIMQSLLDKSNEILQQMDRSKMDDATLKELASSFGVIFDRLRLARGQSTQNLNVNNLSGMISQVSTKPIIEKFVDVEVVESEESDVESSERD